MACARRAAAAGTERGLGVRAGKQDGGWTGRPTNRQTDGCIPGTDGGGEADINARVLLTAPRGLWDPTDDGQGWAASLGSTVCAASGGENCGTSPSRAVKRDRRGCRLALVDLSSNSGRLARAELANRWPELDAGWCSHKLPCPRVYQYFRRLATAPRSVAPLGGGWPLVSRVPWPWECPLQWAPGTAH